jgi:hypothetical protein
MTTVTINECTKAGKTLLDLAKILAVKNSGITVNETRFFNDDDSVAYTIKSYPVSKEKYISLVKEADERISNGKYTTSEDLDQEIKTWQ